MNPIRFLPLAVLVAACAPASGPLSDAQTRAVDREVREASAALVDAMNAHEADTILSFYRLDDAFTYVGCTGMTFQASVFEGLLRGYHRNNPDAETAMSVQRLRVLDAGTAVVTLQGSSGDIEALFTTRVFQRGDEGGWQVVYEHESWPGCPDPVRPHPGSLPGDTVSLAPIGEGS